MNLAIVLGVGAIIGALDGIGIFFVPEEPYKVEIFLAAILKGLLVSLLTGLSLAGQSPWWSGVGYGRWIVTGRVWPGELIKFLKEDF